MKADADIGAAGSVKNSIRVSELSFRYGDTSVFENLSFSSSHNLIALQGPSGSGKTTLLKLLAGFLEPSGGKIIVGAASGILILQDDALLPWLTGEENLRLSQTYSEKRLSNPAIADSFASFVGRPAHHMSFGQRRYVELVRCLGSASEIVFLDEPLNFLDQVRRRIVIDEIVAQSRTRTVISSTHYIEDFGGAPIERWVLDGDPPHSAIRHLDGLKAEVR